MNKEEAKKKIESIIPTRRFYQPVIGFPQCTKRSEAQFRERLDAILRDCEGAKGKAFLIGGSSVGYNAFELAKLGGQVLGVESDMHNIKFCELLKDYREIKEDNPAFIRKTILNFFRESSSRFHYGLLLMVFHHIFKPHSMVECKETMNYFANRCGVTYLSSRDKPWMKEKLGMTYKDIPEYLVNNTDFNNWKEIQMPLRGSGTPDIAFGLPIWALWK